MAEALLSSDEISALEKAGVPEFFSGGVLDGEMYLKLKRAVRDAPNGADGVRSVTFTDLRRQSGLPVGTVERFCTFWVSQGVLSTGTVSRERGSSWSSAELKALDDAGPSSCLAAPAGAWDSAAQAVERAGGKKRTAEDCMVKAMSQRLRRAAGEKHEGVSLSAADVDSLGDVAACVAGAVNRTLLDAAMQAASALPGAKQEPIDIVGRVRAVERIEGVEQAAADLEAAGQRMAREERLLQEVRRDVEAHRAIAWLNHA